MARRIATVLVATLVTVVAIALTPLWAQQQLSTDLATLAKQLKHSAWQTQYYRDGQWHNATVYFKGDKGWFEQQGSPTGKLSNLIPSYGGGGLFQIQGKWSVGDNFGYFKFVKSSPDQGDSFAGEWGEQPGQKLGDWNGKLLSIDDP